MCCRVLEWVEAVNSNKVDKTHLYSETFLYDEQSVHRKIKSRSKWPLRVHRYPYLNKPAFNMLYFILLVCILYSIHCIPIIHIITHIYIFERIILIMLLVNAVKQWKYNSRLFIFLPAGNLYAQGSDTKPSIRIDVVLGTNMYIFIML